MPKTHKTAAKFSSCNKTDHAAFCVCGTPDWKSRAEALYALLGAREEWPESVGTLRDGRMVATGQTLSVVEG